MSTHNVESMSIDGRLALSERWAHVPHVTIGIDEFVCKIGFSSPMVRCASFNHSIVVTRNWNVSLDDGG